MKNSCIVDNEDMEELKKVIEKKSIQKKSSYTYVCTNIFFHEAWTSKYFFCHLFTHS